MNSLVSVNETRTGDRIIAITGSPKTKNLQARSGEVVGYATFNLSQTHYVLTAVVSLDSGETVETSRLKKA